MASIKIADLQPIDFNMHHLSSSDLNNITGGCFPEPDPYPWPGPDPEPDPYPCPGPDPEPGGPDPDPFIEICWPPIY